MLTYTVYRDTECRFTIRAVTRFGFISASGWGSGVSAGASVVGEFA